MPEFLFFGLEILFGVGAGNDFAGDALDHVDSGAFEGVNFFGIVGKQADARDSECFEHLGGQRVVAVVVLEAEAFVGFDGVQSRVLEFVGLQLGHQADAASFLLFVDQDAGAFFSNHREREFQLLATVAAQGVEDVAGQALGMYAYEGRSGFDIAHH